MFAPKAEKELYRALQAKDVDAMERISQTDPNHAFASAVLAAFLHLAAGRDARARELLTWAFAKGNDPASDPFIARYVTARLGLQVAEGATVELGLDRSAVGLALAELHQAAGDLTAAIDVVEQLEPTAFAALSLAELYSEAGRHGEVVALTEGIGALLT